MHPGCDRCSPPIGVRQTRQHRRFHLAPALLSPRRHCGGSVRQSAFASAALCQLSVLLAQLLPVALSAPSPLLTKMSEAPPVFRVMTFNLWHQGEKVHNGLEKIAAHISAIDPDIVALQELGSVEVGKHIIDLLGTPKWKIAHDPYAIEPHTAIITKHEFASDNIVALQFKRNISDFLFSEEKYLNNSTRIFATGASVQLSLEKGVQTVNFFSLHLDYKSYGPYAAYNRLVRSADQIMAGERNLQGYGRAQNIEQLLADDAFKACERAADKQPLIVAGDFNSPSHLDWGEETKDIHGGWTFEWPATKLMADAGFVDSFRAIHPDVLADPGTTWSTVQKWLGPEWDWTIPEPQDRIDFVLYRPSAHFRPLNSFTYAGEAPLKPIPNHWENEWPSDHYAVVTDFQMREEGGDANKTSWATANGDFFQ